MGTHSPAPKVAFAIHVDLVEARAVIPARLLPQLDLVAFGSSTLIEVLYFVADTMYTAVVGELEDVLLFVVREMATVSVQRPVICRVPGMRPPIMSGGPMGELRGRQYGVPEEHVLTVQGNLANTYTALGRLESALEIKRDVYTGTLKLLGNEHLYSLSAANNYAWALNRLERFEEAKSVLRRTVPVARRVLGEGHETTLKMRKMYAIALGSDTGATLDDLREAAKTLEEAAKTARRVLGGSHPFVGSLERSLKSSRAVLRARETPSGKV